MPSSTVLAAGRGGQRAISFAAADPRGRRRPAEGQGMPNKKKAELRSKLWFDNPENPGMTALYLERYLNYGLTREELQSGKPIIGIAQTGSDLSPCNRHHLPPPP